MLIDNATYQRETLSERPIRLPLSYNKKISLHWLLYREDEPGHVKKPVVVDSVTLVDAMEESEPKDQGLRFRLGESKSTKCYCKRLNSLYKILTISLYKIPVNCYQIHHMKRISV